MITAEESRITEAAQDIEALGAKVYTVQADLTKDEEVKRLWDGILATRRPVDAIALNAGIGTAGDFTRETELETELKIIDLNVRSTVHLAKLAAKQMVGRRAGRILITASIAGTMPTPFMAVYGASKAFDLEFAQSLRYELKDTGVTVTALKPGGTDTDFFRRADMGDTEIGSSGKESNDPAEVAKQGFDALMRGGAGSFRRLTQHQSSRCHGKVHAGFCKSRNAREDGQAWI